MELVIFISLVLVSFQVDADPMTVGEISAINCISSQNLQGYAEKIAILMTQDKAPVDDKKLNKFMACHWKNKGLLDETGNVDSNNLKDYLLDLFSNGVTATEAHREIAQTVVQRCVDTMRSKNSGQNAVMVQNCITAYLSNYAEV